MTDSSAVAVATAPPAVLDRASLGTRLRPLVIGTIAFLTLVDLFATQAILPSLARHFEASPAAMGSAVNASTMGMAVAGLLVAFFSRRLDRRLGVILSLALLAIPTALLALAPDLASFTALRIAQGLCMATAFSLTLAYLGERCSAGAAAGAFAAYITGNVASNLLGRMLAAAAVDQVGLAGNFYLFALLNLGGAILAWLTLRGTQRQPLVSHGGTARADRLAHFRNPALLAGFAMGFLILFAFIGTFTFVNFVLVSAPITLSPMTLGLVYLVFLPAIVTTPLAGLAVTRHGVRTTLVAAVSVAALGLPFLLVPDLVFVMLGLALIGIGTFFAQATATGFVSRAATTDRGAVSGIYLASYFAGGLVGTVVLGQVFDHLGWAACVGGIGLALAVAALLARNLRLPAITTAS